MNIEKLEPEILQVVQNAAEFLNKSFKTPLNVQIKKDRSWVTQIDEQAQAQMEEGLKKIIPKAYFIGEEHFQSKAEALDALSKVKNEPCWILDPLDGTTNFIRQIPFFCISLGLRVEGEFQFGVIHIPQTQEVFTVHKGKGVFLNHSKVTASTCAHLDDSVLSTGFPHYQQKHASTLLNKAMEINLKSHGVRKLGSAAVALAYTASGRFDGFFEYGLAIWDIAAGLLMCQEAGAKVTTFKGKDFNALQDLDLLVASEKLSPELVQYLENS